MKSAAWLSLGEDSSEEDVALTKSPNIVPRSGCPTVLTLCGAGAAIGVGAVALALMSRFFSRLALAAAEGLGSVLTGVLALWLLDLSKAALAWKCF